MIYNIDTSFHYKEIIETILSQSPESVTQKLECTGMFSFDDLGSKLANLSANSKVVDLYGKLTIVNVSKFIIPHSQITLKLEFNDPKLIIIEKDMISDAKATSSSLDVQDVKLYIKNYVLKDSFAMDLERMINKYPVIYEYKKAVIQHVTIPLNCSSYSSQTIYTGKIYIYSH